MEPITNGGNPGGFDFKQYASDRGLFYRVFLPKGAFVVSSKKSGPAWQGWPGKLRMRMVEAIRKYVKDERASGVAAALLTGYRADMDKEIAREYAATGVAHIIAISGLHLGMIQVALFFMLQRLSTLKHGKSLRALLVIGLLWAFALMTGAGASVLRSALMFTILLFGDVIGRKGNAFNSLAASAFMLLLYNPVLLFDVGFQLSYSAVLSIFIFNPSISGWVKTERVWLHRTWQMISVTLSAQILTLPFVVYYFHQFPLYFILANLITIPVSGIALHLLLLLMLVFWWAPPLAMVLGKLTEILILFMNASVHWIQQIPASRMENIYLPLPQAILMMAIISLVAATFLLKRRPAAIWAMGLLFTFIAYREIVWQQNSGQRGIIVYNIANHNAIDLVNGHSVVFAGDTGCLNDQELFLRQLQPARILWQASPAGILNINDSGYHVITAGPTTLLVLDKEPDLFKADTVSADILLIAANIRANPSRVLEKIKCKTIVATAKLPVYRLPRWQIAADSLHLRLHPVAEKGAFVLDLNRSLPF